MNLLQTKREMKMVTRTKEVPTDVLLVLEESTINGNELHLPDRQLPNYPQVKKVLLSVGGKWNKKSKSHVFDGDPTDVIDELMLTGEYSGMTSLAQQLQYFPTPEAVLDLMMDYMPPALDVGGPVLEPSAGKGAIVDRLYDEGHRNVVCIEQHEPFRKLLMDTNAEVLGCTDFLTHDPVKEEVGKLYAAICANPPFTKQQDIDHVRHMLKCLQPGGHLVTVMSVSVTFRTNKKTTSFIEELEALDSHEFIEIPEGSFKESGTGVNTILLVATK
jgi:phospholipid N-methyltransferase